MRNHGWMRWIAAVAAAAGLSACTSSRPAAPPVAVDDAGPPVTYVAVGASDSVGVGTSDPLREAWPQLLYNEALPRRTVFVNLGIPGATVDEALNEELGPAVDLSPTIVTVWLNVNDLAAQVTPARYEQQLGELVHGLRRGDATKVLVANTPPLSGLPAVSLLRLPAAAVDRAVDDYNAAIARVAAREGAVLVDLHAAYLAAQAQGRAGDLVSSDGFHPSAAGHRAVAAAFAKALGDTGGVR